MTEPVPVTRRDAAWIGGVLMAVAVCVLAVVKPGCTPAATPYVEPLVGVAPMVCDFYPAGSAEQRVCQASVALTAALAILAAQRAQTAASSSATAPPQPLSAEPLPVDVAPPPLPEPAPSSSD